jgi:NAD(P)-dependent dehydrogenase (short-subunit alcohol dehydrogenase family)
MTSSFGSPDAAPRDADKQPRQGAYAATKWALEALVEALVIEAGPLGIEAALLEPGAVSSGALDHVTTYTLPGDPYAHLRTQGGARARGMITPEEVAAGIADAAQAPQLPLRIPLGRTACEVLAARRAAPDDRPFIPGEFTPVPAADAN